MRQQVWAASGTAIVSIAGMILFNEQKDIIQMLCLVMIVVGVVGLELRSS
jgi:multidrug transporter EmrE-like cation transporter